MGHIISKTDNDQNKSAPNDGVREILKADGGLIVTKALNSIEYEATGGIDGTVALQNTSTDYFYLPNSPTVASNKDFIVASPTEQHGLKGKFLFYVATNSSHISGGGT
jgi:hypothetical protein